MNGNKTLVEQIRDMVDESKREDGTVFAFPAFTDAATGILGYKCNCAADEVDLFTKIENRIEREYMPLPLDANGMLIKPGDKIFLVGLFEPCEVCGFEFKNDKILVRIVSEDEAHVHISMEPEKLTHDPTDTLDRIEADARKATNVYWECISSECDECPAIVDGKKPWERYETRGSCSNAQKLDLLRRQREVFEREQV